MSDIPPKGALLEKEPPKDENKEAPAEKHYSQMDEKEKRAFKDRFNEVLKQRDEQRKKAEEHEKELDAMRETVLKMERRLQEVAEKKADKQLPPEPDKDIDPEAHKAWVKLRDAEREKEREKKDMEKEVQLAIRIVSAQYDDYEDVVKLAEKHMAKHPEEAKKVWADPVQAPAKAYRLGKKLQEEANKVKDEEAARLKRIKAGETLEDGGDGSGDEDEVELSPEQERVIKRLYPDEDFATAKKRYIKNMGGK